MRKFADVAHLVERHLAKVEVAGSSPVVRSNFILALRYFYRGAFLFVEYAVDWVYNVRCAGLCKDLLQVNCEFTL